MNNILKIGILLRDSYQVTDLLSNNSGFGITCKIKDSNHPNQPIRILKQLKKTLNLTLTGCQKPEEVVFSCEKDSNGDSVTKVQNIKKVRDLIV